METKALFGSCFWVTVFFFFFHFWVILFGILSTLDIDQKILCE